MNLHCKKCGCILEKNLASFGGGYTHKFFTFAQAASWCEDNICEPKEKMKPKELGK